MKTNSALTAQAIRTEWKQLFPQIKFTVKKRGYDCVTINYTDSIIEDEIEKVVSKYQQGHFNGMEDIYEYSNCIEGQLQVNYVFVTRDMSETVKEKLMAIINTTYHACQNLCYNDYSNEWGVPVASLVRRLFVKESF